VLFVSLLLNIAVLVPVVASLALNARWVERAWGERTPARDILLAIYCAILLASTGMLVLAIIGGVPVALAAAAVALFTVQIVYKVLTAVTVRNALRNPVVISNLGIALVHGVTVATLLPILT
jgi:hypothetical protein